MAGVAADAKLGQTCKELAAAHRGDERRMDRVGGVARPQRSMAEADAMVSAPGRMSNMTPGVGGRQFFVDIRRAFVRFHA